MHTRTLTVVLAAMSLLACGTTMSEATGKKTFDSICASCHGAAGGGAIGPNITGSTAGIGSWTEAQFRTSLRDGKDDEGKTLCSTMPRYSAAQLSDAQVSELFAYVKTLSSDKENSGSACP